VYRVKPFRALLVRALLATTLLVATACTGDDEPAGAAPPLPSESAPTTPGPTTSASTSGTATPAAPRTTPPAPRPDATPRVAGVVARDLEAPWAIAFLPDGDALVTERDRARIVRVSARGGVRPVGEVAGVQAQGEGGLLGLAVSPTFARDRFVFVYFTADDDNRVVRMTYGADGRLGSPQVILSGIEKAGIHNGGRLAFGPDGFLYVATGDASERGLSQDRRSLNGKVLRITADGAAAPGNPFPGSRVWTYGHRNVQGLGWDSRGRLWASEFGQRDWDELNLLVPGRNYGWPDVEGPSDDNRYEPPQAAWRTDDNSPSGVAVAGDAVYMAGLRGARLWQIAVNGTRAGRPRDFLRSDYGRLRAVTVAPDGSLWVSTSNRDGRGDPRDGDDKILRVVLG
jgi:glucose/arabinose dehydrogenase